MESRYINKPLVEYKDALCLLSVACWFGAGSCPQVFALERIFSAAFDFGGFGPCLEPVLLL
jgi:hypothetical protein